MSVINYIKLLKTLDELDIFLAFFLNFEMVGLSFAVIEIIPCLDFCGKGQEYFDDD